MLEVDIQFGSCLLAAWLEWWKGDNEGDADLAVADCRLRAEGDPVLMAGEDSALIGGEVCANCARLLAGVVSALCQKPSQHLMNQSIKMYLHVRLVLNMTSQCLHGASWRHWNVCC